MSLLMFTKDFMILGSNQLVIAAKPISWILMMMIGVGHSNINQARPDPIFQNLCIIPEN